MFFFLPPGKAVLLYKNQCPGVLDNARGPSEDQQGDLDQHVALLQAPQSDLPNRTGPALLAALSASLTHQS